MNDEKLLRYSRQILLPEVDIVGQQKLFASKILIVGLGGLGSPVTLYLASAGIGNLTLLDYDKVELSNLQRQIVHKTKSIGIPKTDSAALCIQDINPEVNIRKINKHLKTDQLEKLISEHDIIVDCSDNFPTRFNINKSCQKYSIPLVSGAVIRFDGQIATFNFRDEDKACYCCLYNESGESEETCSNSGILAPMAGIIGSIQAVEVLKLVLELPTLSGYLQILDGKRMHWKTLKLQKDPLCPICSENPQIQSS